MILLPDQFWQQVEATTASATASGALQPIPTAYEIIECQGIPFLVRILTRLIKKEEEKAKQAEYKEKTGQNFDPFLPYEEDLFVSDISDTHLCLLNKYNVVDHHLLIVTRDFEEQEDLINHADLTALCACLKQINGLGFYNSGQDAGASVRHKHLQLIPKSLAPDFNQIPITPAFQNTDYSKTIQQVPLFPFSHGFAWLNLDWTASPENLAQEVLAKYKQLLETINYQSGVAYNFLMTREWMFMVSRKQEKFQSIGINSLGFAGALLVKTQEELQLVKEETPLKILTTVAQDKSTN
ncbi:ATP adenylyltransferase [Halothece sp. PCC 7418]|uniref:ATP adenylyltransferase family protein n=1 Tax=Halothece sp. (strain PCC 7418) TaxID=65093 RepID=UPI0002A069A8|nr:ATP adenylyltransferase [Halothece sp. PCC 7418]AFZ44205.1 ATP adenylyltransferase [Halothece sp. PCC 7418]